MTQQVASSGSFNDLGISASLLAVLERHHFSVPTPIQKQAIPVALQGKDVVGIAQTGTGKTLAFGLPLIQNLGISKGKGLIILPTRELALQVNETLEKIGRSLGLRTAVLIGGAAFGQQIQHLNRKPHVIVATPGRLVDHIERKTVSLHDIKLVVLDEADRMFDIGFAPQIKRILTGITTERQTLLFSATMPKEIAELAARYMKNPVRVEVAPAGTSASQIEQGLFVIKKDEKSQLLDKLLVDHPGTVLIFSRTKHGAKRIAATVRAMNHTATELHSNRSLAQRKAALEGFKKGTYRVLVATDIAARGIDVSNITLVINYDLPDNPEDYVHRIGRTGRAGSSGKAISFVAPEDRNDVRNIERLIKKPIPILPLPVLPPRRSLPPPTHNSPQHHGQRNVRAGGFRGSAGGNNSRRRFR